MSGLLFVFFISILLSVGAFCERPRANTVRPYRVSVKDFVISPLNLHTLFGEIFFKSIDKVFFYGIIILFPSESGGKKRSHRLHFMKENLNVDSDGNCRSTNFPT